VNWNDYFVSLLGPIAAKSKDTSRKVGCIIVGPDKEIRSTGFNGLPRGCNDTLPERYARPEKYFWFEHAERNAIYNAARHGASLEGCTAYVNMPPCMDCARGIVQSGISMVVSPAPPPDDPKYAEDFERIKELFEECDVSWHCVSNLDAPEQRSLRWVSL